jgi:hypothetical protein
LETKKNSHRDNESYAASSTKQAAKLRNDATSDASAHLAVVFDAIHVAHCIVGIARIIVLDERKSQLFAANVSAACCGVPSEPAPLSFVAQSLPCDDDDNASHRRSFTFQNIKPTLPSLIWFECDQTWQTYPPRHVVSTQTRQHARLLLCCGKARSKTTNQPLDQRLSIKQKPIDKQAKKRSIHSIEGRQTTRVKQCRYSYRLIDNKNSFHKHQQTHNNYSIRNIID